MAILIGVDVGQIHEPSGICVLEETEPESEYEVRFLQQLPPGNTFVDIAARVGEVVARIPPCEDRTPTLYVDATGLGEPIIRMIRQQVGDAEVIAVYFNHGDKRCKESSTMTLGKAYLVTRLKALLQSQGRYSGLFLPQTEESAKLRDELLQYQVTTAPDANERYGAFPVGTRDELVTALGMPVCDDERIHSILYKGY